MFDNNGYHCQQALFDRVHRRVLSNASVSIKRDHNRPWWREAMVSISSLPVFGTITNRTSCSCNVWFDQSKKRPRSPNDFGNANEILPAADQSTVDTNQENISGKKRKRAQDDDLSIVPFKNVKLAGREVGLCRELSTEIQGEA